MTKSTVDSSPYSDHVIDAPVDPDHDHAGDVHDDELLHEGISGVTSPWSARDWSEEDLEGEAREQEEGQDNRDGECGSQKSIFSFDII